MQKRYINIFKLINNVEVFKIKIDINSANLELIKLIMQTYNIGYKEAKNKANMYRAIIKSNM